MRKTVGTMLALVLWAAAATAQTAQTPVARERVLGPQVDFLAVTPTGMPVTDLKADEVEIRIEGRARAIRSLRLVSAAPAVLGSGPVPALLPPYGGNSRSDTGRTFVVVIDDESFVAGREQPLRNAVDGLLQRLIPTDRVMLSSVPYRGERVPLTRDHGRLRTALTMFTGQRSREETGSEMACRTRLVLQAVTDLLEQFRGAPEPVTILLMTGGLAATRRDAPFAMAPGMCELKAVDFQRVGVAAGAARANVYLVQPDEIGRAAGDFHGGGSTNGSDNPLEGIEHLSGVTGGTRVPMTALGTSALARVANETSSYYLAELEPEASDRNGRTRPLSVRVNRRHVTVRTRPEITFATRATTAPVTKVTASEMVLMAEGFPDLPVRAAAYTMERAADGRVKVVAVGDVLDRSVPIESAAAALIDGSGRVMARWNAADAGESPLMGAMLVFPGPYRLRLAVVDANGRAGAADFDFDARLTDVGPLQLGSVVIGLSRDGVLIPRLEFGNEPSALASFEISGGSEGLPIYATLEIAQSDLGPAIVTVPLAISSLGPRRFLAMGTVPLGALPAGDYVVRGLIRIEDGAAGSVLRTLRKR
jgi:VWFA-related protein